MSIHQKAFLLVLALAGAFCLPSSLAAGLEDVMPEEEGDEISVFQRPMVLAKSKKHKRTGKEPQLEPKKPVWPMLIPLEKESVPIVRNNRVVSHKTSFSGNIRVGSPSQDFRVVFDTGSGHIVVPSTQCTSETCKAHRRYNMTASSQSVALNADGTNVPEGELCDQVTIGYGTGEVMGELARDRVCLGAEDSTCIETGIIMAVEMTEKPFKSFRFDGIFGLSLDALAVSPLFSFHNSFEAAKLGALPQFGIFLSDQAGSDPGGSEIALGGYNPERLLTPLHWVPVAKQELGHWMVTIKEVRIGNKTLNICQDGSCRGVVDSGTSHLGVPSAHHAAFAQAMSVPSAYADGEGHADIEGADGQEDCREAVAPELELVLEGLTVKVGPEFYMRPLPVKASSVRGLLPQPAGPKAAAHSATDAGAAATAAATAAASANTQAAARAEAQAAAPRSASAPSSAVSSMVCAPKVLPMKLPALGQNVFILGEPILNRYYTAYDWKQKAVGFGLSAIAQNQQLLAKAGTTDSGRGTDDDHEDGEEVYSFVQMTVQVVRIGRGQRRQTSAQTGENCHDSASSSGELEDEQLERPSHFEL